MRIATFNIENIFYRDTRLLQDTGHESREARIKEFDHLLKTKYRSHKDLERLRDLAYFLGFQKSFLEPYVVLFRKAGSLFLRGRQSKSGQKANHFSNWDGWIKVATQPLKEQAIYNKARLISEVKPDILILQEVEDQQSLADFNENYLPEDVRFSEVLVLPGNDPHGIGLGIMTRGGYSIKSVKSHSNYPWGTEKLFDKDLQEYEVSTPEGEKLWILSAHLQPETTAKNTKARRKLQTQRITKVYDQLVLEGKKEIVIAGTFNAPSYCASLSPLLSLSHLKEVKKHASFNVDLDQGKDAGYFSLGAYRRGVNLKQKDYLLLSSSLFSRIKNSGLNRKGVWPPIRQQYGVYNTLEAESQQASSHPLIWVDL